MCWFVWSFVGQYAHTWLCKLLHVPSLRLDLCTRSAVWLQVDPALGICAEARRASGVTVRLQTRRGCCSDAVLCTGVHAKQAQ